MHRTMLLLLFLSVACALLCTDDFLLSFSFPFFLGVVLPTLSSLRGWAQLFGKFVLRVELSVRRSAIHTLLASGLGCFVAWLRGRGGFFSQLIFQTAEACSGEMGWIGKKN